MDTTPHSIGLRQSWEEGNMEKAARTPAACWFSSRRYMARASPLLEIDTFDRETIITAALLLQTLPKLWDKPSAVDRSIIVHRVWKLRSSAAYDPCLLAFWQSAMSDLADARTFRFDRHWNKIGQEGIIMRGVEGDKKRFDSLRSDFPARLAGRLREYSESGIIWRKNSSFPAFSLNYLD